MSRPPRPESTRPLRADLTPRDGHLDYFPLDFRGLVDLAANMGSALPPDARDPTATLYELSALVAHVLAVHQDHIAGEAFLGTASTARSLVKHGRRLAYEPAPGSTATGYLSVEAKAGLSGELPAGVVASTSPAGGVPAQDFETAVARRIEAAWNRLEIRAADRLRVITIPSTTTEVRVAGTGHGFRAGEPAIITGPQRWGRIEITGVVEVNGETRLKLEGGIGVNLGAGNDPANYTIWSRPAVDVRLFGWNADASLFPPSQLESAEGYTPPAGTPGPSTPPTYGYQVTSPSNVATTATSELFLASTIAEPLAGEHVLVVEPVGPSVIMVNPTGSPQVDTAVRFVRGATREVVTGVNLSTGAVTTAWVLDERSISGTLTRLRASSRVGTVESRATVGVHSRLFSRWRTSAPLVGRESSQQPLNADQDFFVEGEHRGLEPGMLVALTTRDGKLAQIVELSQVSVTTGVTRLRYKERTARPTRPSGTPHTWELGDVVILGNIVPAVHGTTREEVLGESDGVTPFQRHKLKKAPLAHVPGGDGVAPDLEVRVGRVRWDRVTDFGVPEPDPTARHYKLERDHDGTTWVRFSDGRSGAVPPSGENNIRAVYRVGLGAEGNVAAGRVTRLMKSHPLVDRVHNPVATSGGTAPAVAEDVRRQATRHIRTFERAVSVRDHADLALLFPGVVRASARFADGAIELVAAANDGLAVPNQHLLLEFLDGRRDTALRLVPIAPQFVPITIRVYIERDEAFLVRDVESAVRAALCGTDPAAPGMFTFAARDLGQAAHASEVHARLARVGGVTFVQLVRFDLAPGTALRDVLQPQPHQWLRLEATALTFATLEEGDHD